MLPSKEMPCLPILKDSQGAVQCSTVQLALNSYCSSFCWRWILFATVLMFNLVDRSLSPIGAAHICSLWSENVLKWPPKIMFMNLPLWTKQLRVAFACLALLLLPNSSGHQALYRSHYSCSVEKKTVKCMHRHTISSSSSLDVDMLKLDFVAPINIGPNEQYLFKYLTIKEVQTDFPLLLLTILSSLQRFDATPSYLRRCYIACGNGWEAFGRRSNAITV